MPAPKTTVWTIEQHTKAKHAILENYLKAWLPIMTSRNGRVIVLDGFAGPGKYADGERGSPIIAIETLLQHSSPAVRQQEVLFLFIEKDEERHAHLKSLLEAKEPELPDNVTYRTFCGEFDDTLSGLLRLLEGQSARLAPTFAFIDPFGYSSTPMETIGRLMRHPKCEVLINIMHGFVNRFVSAGIEANDAHYDRLLATPKWRDIVALDLPPDQRERRIHDLYQQQLRDFAGATYVRSFGMTNKFNQTEYYLFFGTTNLTGFDKMKQAMWKVDPGGAFEFSDRTDPNQPVLLAPEPNYVQLKTMLRDKFRGTVATVAQIEHFVVASTPFHSGQYKTSVLKPMEQAGEVVAVSPPQGRRAWSYKEPSLRLRFA